MAIKMIYGPPSLWTDVQISHDIMSLLSMGFGKTHLFPDLLLTRVFAKVVMLWLFLARRDLYGNFNQCFPIEETEMASGS